ncbi:MAG: HD domain-containing protein [bacterium]|nr:HD domain-containing protein [bacterium]
MSLSEVTVKQLNETITQLNFALSNALLYPPGHPIVDQSLKKVHLQLLDLMKSFGDITLTFLEEELMYQNEPILESSFLAHQFVAMFRKRGVGSIGFTSGLEFEELRAFIYAFHVVEKMDEIENAFHNELVRRNVTHIVLSKPAKAKKSGTAQSRWEGAKQIYAATTKLVESTMLTASTEKVVEVDNVKPVVKQIVENLMDDPSILMSLASIKSFDNYLFTHSVNVCILTLAQAMHLNLDAEFVLQLGMGSLLHDLGKTFIPAEILNKPGKLSDEEWEIMKQHPIEGMKLILKSKYVTQLPAILIYGHHWKYNYSGGYPAVTRKPDWNRFVGIVTISDCYDAITTNRPYNRLHLPSEAVSVIKKMAGIDFDPVLVKHFITILGSYPIGSLVGLNNGDLALVLQATPEDPQHPKVRIIADEQGKKYDEITLLDLSEKDEDENIYPLYIEKTVDPEEVHIRISDYL